MNKIRLIIWICFPLLLCTALYGQSTERWYAVSIGGNPVGYLLEKAETSAGLHTSFSEMNISIGRMGSSVKMETKTTQMEQAGELRSIHAEMNFSNEKKVESVRVDGDHLRIESQGMPRTIPLDVKLSGPGILHQSIVQLIRDNRGSFDYTTYSAELGMFLNGKQAWKGREKVEVNGELFEAVLLEESFQELPYSRKKWLTTGGRLLKSTEPSPFGDMEVVWTSKENALSTLNNSVDLPEEQYGSAMAYANHRFSDPRAVSAVTLRITQKRPEFGFPDFSGEYQKVLSRSAEAVVLQIRKPELGQEHTPDDLKEYLEPNAFLDNSDTLVIQKIREITEGETDNLSKVKRITDWVRNNMSFDPGIALADSREVMRDLKGTCVSYALLTATMSKAAGIPARFLMGYVYVDGAWGGHAWAEVNLNGQWLPVDAAVPNDTYIADAARFFMVRSSLKNGMGTANIAGMQLFGNIEVTTIDYLQNGKVFTATEKPYLLENNRYRNGGLNFSMEGIKGFEFSDMARFYPESILLKQSNQGRELIVEHWSYGTNKDRESSIEKMLGSPIESEAVGSGLITIGSDKSVAVLKDGTRSFFSLTATGQGHEELVQQALELIRITVNP